MMDKKPHIKPYIYGMLAGFGAISLSILFFFFIYRFDGFGDAVSTMTGILMPFIYGAVIAYLLKPVCNTIENFLHRIFPQRHLPLLHGPDQHHPLHAVDQHAGRLSGQCDPDGLLQRRLRCHHE